MTKYHVFKPKTSAGRRAVTDDKSGAKLPTEFGPWVLEKEIDLQPGEHRIGASANDIMAAVKKDGYYMWPQPKEDAA
jgi:hypothetical protein